MKAGLVGLVVAMIAALALAASVSASDGATVTHFTLAYPDGSAQCSGNRIQRDGRNGFIKDAETCITTITFFAPGTYSLSDPSSPAYGWCSDFDGFATCNLATSGTLTATYNKNGTVTWDIVAYFAAP